MTTLPTFHHPPPSPPSYSGRFCVPVALERSMSRKSSVLWAPKGRQVSRHLGTTRPVGPRSAWR